MNPSIKALLQDWDPEDKLNSEEQDPDHFIFLKNVFRKYAPDDLKIQDVKFAIIVSIHLLPKERSFETLRLTLKFVAQKFVGLS